MIFRVLLASLFLIGVTSNAKNEFNGADISFAKENARQIESLRSQFPAGVKFATTEELRGGKLEDINHSGAKTTSAAGGPAREPAIFAGVRSRLTSVAESSRQAVLKNYYAAARYLKLFIPIKKPVEIKGAPTAGGGYYLRKYGSGSIPEVIFYTMGAITDDGSIARITWNFGDGTSVNMPPIMGGNAYIRHVYTTANHYDTFLEIEDNLGAVTKYTAYVETFENAAPTPKFSIINNGGTANAITYESLSTDRDGENLSYYWNFGDGTSSGQRLGAKLYSAPGTYDVSLQVTDGSSMEDVATAQVTVSGTTVTAKPAAVIDQSVRYGVAPLTVDFSGSNSFDIDGTVTFYRWESSIAPWPGAGITGQKALFTFERPGTYSVKLSVYDNAGNIGQRSVDIYVDGPETTTPEIVAFENGGRSVRFDNRTPSLNALAAPDCYSWSFGDGSSAVGRPQTKTYTADGTYNVQLTVRDVRARAVNAALSIVVDSTTDSPIATASVTPDFANTNQTVTYGSVGSSDPLGQPLNYRWRFSDGLRASTTATTYSRTYETPGVKNYELVVTNSRGMSALSSYFSNVKNGEPLEVQVKASPLVSAGPAVFTFNASSTRSFNGKITKFQFYIDGVYVGDGPIQTVTISAVGTHYYQFYATDARGTVAGFQDKIEVVNPASIPGGNVAPVAVVAASYSPVDKRIYFNCASSTDSDGSIANCAWTLNGSAYGNSKYKSILNPDPILYTIEATVSDNWGKTSTATNQVDLRTSIPTTTNFDFSPQKPLTNASVTFGAEKSSVASGAIRKFEWSFGDSTSGTGAVVTHPYAAAGTYTVTLTTTDLTNATRTATKSIVVAAAQPTPALVIVARDSSVTGYATNGSTLRTLGFPATVRFSMNSPGSNGLIQSAVWNFGTGESGYGRDVEYNFKNAGTYTVTANGIVDGITATQVSMTVVISELGSCLNSPEETLCLRHASAVGGTYPVSLKTWTVNHNLTSTNWSTTAAQYPAAWIKLRAEDGSGDEIDISSATTRASAALTITRDTLLKLNPDLTRPYRFVVQGRSTTGAAMLGQSSEFYFGTNQLDVTASEAGAFVELFTTLSNHHYFRSLGVATTVNFADLPSGPAVLIVTKGAKKVFKKIQLGVYDRQALTVNLDEVQTLATFKRGPKMRPSRVWAKRYATANASTKLTGDSSLPSWTQGLCGEDTPFSAAGERKIGEGESSVWGFSSAEPVAQSEFRAIPTTMDKPVRVSCGVATEALLFGQNKWKFKDGPLRCSGDPNPHSYWKQYLSGLAKESAPITVRYEIRDAWATSEVVKGHFVTSSRDMMLNNGWSIADLTSRLGIWTDEVQDGKMRTIFDVQIPKQFKRPEIRFILESENSSDPASVYRVDCDVLDFSDRVPKIARFESTTLDTTAPTLNSNARNSLDPRFGFFPVQYDGRAAGAATAVANSAKAQYAVAFNIFERSDVTWQGVGIKVQYGEQDDVLLTVPFDSAPTVDPDTGYVKGTITIATSALLDLFKWRPGFNKVNLKIRPLGKITTNYDFSGSNKDYEFTALFDLQSVKAQQLPNICEAGFFGTVVSTFVREDVVRALSGAKLGSATMRCGDFSLPFGGAFFVSSAWQKAGNQYGTAGLIRTLNVTGSHDFYDDFSIASPDRKADVQEYQLLSTAAVTLAAEVNPISGGVSTPKQKILDFCKPAVGNPLPPCTSATVFADIDADKIIKVCQWYGTTTVPVDGCPTYDRSKVARFSKWVELNAGGLSDLFGFSSLQSRIATGFTKPATPATTTGWQYDALVKGTWPDGRVIYRASIDFAQPLSQVRASVCHADINGCTEIANSFVHSFTLYDSILINLGWR